MDFLDPVKSKQKKAVLYVGYFFSTLLVILTTLVMVYLVRDGYSINNGGKVVQNGLVFLSTQPRPADIYLNGKLNNAKTNKHIFIPQGIYDLELARAGYRNWTRSIEVDGAQILHIDYPLLVPTNLTSSKIHSYSAQPGLNTATPDHKKILIALGAQSDSFEIVNISDPRNLTYTNISIPETLISKTSTPAKYTLINWADDNKHVLLTRNFSGGSEYILLDITDANNSVNLSRNLANVQFNSIDLINKKYDQYYLYSSSGGTLSKVQLTNLSQVTAVLSGILAYSSYGNNQVLYATADQKDASKVDFLLKDSDKLYTVKTLPAGGNYLLDLATYQNVPYIVVGSSAQNKVYIYKDPISQINNYPKQDPVPSQVLFVRNPNYLKFSANAEFIMAENGRQFAVYDILSDHGYNFLSKFNLDAPQAHANWMDAYRITYISNSKVITFEFDNNYRQVLTNGDPNYPTIFDGNNTYLYSVLNTNGQYSLNRTSFYTPNDQP